MAFQTLYSGLTEESICNLQPGYEGLYTGRTGNCTCLILLWDFNAPRKSYGSMRGMHFLGGIQVLSHNPTLQKIFFQDVPDVAASLIIAVGAGINDPADGETARVGALARECLPHATLMLPNATHACVYRNGTILENQIPPREQHKACCIIL